MKTRIYNLLILIAIGSAIYNPSLLHAQPIKDSILENYTQKDYEDFLLRELRGEIPVAYGPVPSGGRSGDALVNNNAGATGTSRFTQSETSILAFGNHVVIGFNDAGSYSGGANKFTGWSYSSDGGATFTDGGTLPTNPIGDAGDPVLARNEFSGRIYYATLGFVAPRTIQVFHSDDNAVTWLDPVNGTPGGSDEDKQWIAVDNFSGPGNGNVYLMSRRFGTGPGIYMFRSTDHGNTFGPNGGSLIVAGKQGAFVIVGPDHSVFAFWYDGTTILMRKSTDLGETFGTPVIVASGLTGGINGGLSLTGLRQGVATYAGFRSNSFPHAAVNPISGDLYVTFNDNPDGTDKGDIFIVMSSDGGATWSTRNRVNDDATTTDNWQPTIAVTSTGTFLGIFYSSREADIPGNNLYTHNGRVGVISGSTVAFTPSFVISDIQSFPEFGRDAIVNATYMGDYNGATATANNFHVVWSDNRDDLGEGAPRKDPNIYYENIPAGVLAGPNIGIPLPVNIGSVAVTQDKTIEIDIVNIGDADLTISSITSPGLDFSLSVPSLPVILPSLGAITIDATLTPLSLGFQTSSFVITSDALNNPNATVSLEGTGITNIVVSPGIDFGNVVVGTTAGPANVGIQNIGSTDLTISSITYPAPDFSSDAVALPVVIPSMGFLNMSVYFTPMVLGLQNSSFEITSDAFETFTVTVNLQGYGYQPPENDLCENAIPIECGDVINGTTVWASFDNIDTCETSNTAPGVWYTFTGTGHQIRINTCAAASYNTKLTVLRGSCEALTCVAGNDNTCSTRSSVFFNTDYGTTYYILVHGYKSEVGTFTLTWATVCPPEISVIPSDLTFNLPLNGVASDQLNIANTAETGAFNLLWKITSSDPEQYLIPLNQNTSGEISEFPEPLPEDSGERELMNAWGPDGFGYVFVDSDELGGPAFSWNDITGTGTTVTLGDDEALQVSLPFVFPFYGDGKTQLLISSNGYLTFGEYGADQLHRPIPFSYAPDDIICPFWTDLDPSIGGTIHYLSTPNSFIVQYTDIRLAWWTEPNTFQVILYDDGSILFQYLAMMRFFSSFTIGIENSTGTIGLQVSYAVPYIENNFAVLITLPVQCPWITSILPSAGTTLAGESQDITVDVDATGLPYGTYNCNIMVFSNDGQTGRIIIPVVLNVEGDDTVPPVITVQEEIILWPADHQYENIDLTEMIVSITDNIDDDIPVSAAFIYSISVDEPDDAPGAGDGNTINDIVIAADCDAADLRKERQGHDIEGTWANGRVYYVVLSVEDAAGNVGTAGFRVLVPHDQAGGAWDDGPDHALYCGGYQPAQPVVTVPENGPGNEFKVNSYPNPASSRITIEFISHKENSYVFELNDLTGRKLIESQGKALTGKNTIDIDLGSLAKGIYMVRLVLDGKQEVKKIVKE